jgi:hypothetical protein
MTEQEQRASGTGLMERLLNPYFFAFVGGVLALTSLRACWY